MLHYFNIKRGLSHLAHVASITLIMCLIVAPLEIVTAEPCNPLLLPPGQSVWTSLDQIRATDCTGTIIRDSDLPYTIATEGIYSLGEDITYGGATAGITIDTTGPVTLNLACHFLRRTGAANTTPAILITSTGSAPVNIIDGKILTRGTGANCIESARAIYVENVEFSHTTAPNGTIGIVAGVTSGVGGTVVNCSFSNMDIGIESQVDGDLITIKNCEFNNCNTAGISSTIGTTIAKTSGGYIVDCAFNNCEEGILLSFTRKWTIDHCFFTNCGATNGSIDFNDVEKTIIKDCEIIASKDHAIVMAGSGGNNGLNDIQIINTVINDATNFGITSDGGVNVTVCGCKITGCGQKGIHVGSSNNLNEDSLIQSCQVLHCDGGGIDTGSILAINSATVWNCTVLHSPPSYSANIMATLLVASTDAQLANANFWWNVDRVSM